MLSSASRRTDRAAAATAALLLQLAFIAAFLHAFSAQVVPEQLQKELIFILPPLPRVKPVAQPEAAPHQATRPVIVIPPPLFTAPPPTPAPSSSAPSSTDLQNFGQALLGCAPETYANLTPQQKALCARPGEGWAMQEAPDPLNTRSHAKDEAHWQEQWTEKHWTAAPCTNVEITYCQMAQLHAERLRAEDANAQIATKKAEALREPERPLVERVGVPPQ